MAALEILALDTATPQIEAPQTGDTYSAPRAISVAPETLTGSTATTSLNITQTWNTTGTPTALNVSVTDTASNAASLLANFQVGGSSWASISKKGAITAGLTGAANALTANAPTLNIRQRMNNAGVAFTLAQLNFEDQSSAQTSKYLDIQNSGASVASFYKTQNYGNAVFVIGASVGSITDPAIVISRGVSTSGSGNAHGFVDITNINRTGTIGYASYDTQPVFSGAVNYDHFAGLQTRPIYSNTGTTAADYGLYSVLTVSAGATVTNRYATYVADATNSGTLGSQYGLYVASLAAGSTNWGVYVAGNNPSFFGGTVRVGGYTVATLPAAGTVGRTAYVTDGDALLVWGATVVNSGAGATKYLVWDNGTNWTVTGK